MHSRQNSQQNTSRHRSVDRSSKQRGFFLRTPITVLPDELGSAPIHQPTSGRKISKQIFRALPAAKNDNLEFGPSMNVVQLRYTFPATGAALSERNDNTLLSTSE